MEDTCSVSLEPVLYPDIDEAAATLHFKFTANRLFGRVSIGVELDFETAPGLRPQCRASSRIYICFGFAK